MSDGRWNGLVTSLETTGVPLPVSAIPSFPLNASTQRWLVGLPAPQADIAWGAIAESSPSRIVPWRRIIRFSRFGRGLTPSCRDAALDGIVEFASVAHALRVHVSMYEPDDIARHALVQGLAQRGFRQAKNRQSYVQTVLIDLRQAEDTLLGSFHSKTRRDIRALEKAGLTCREIANPALAPRMNELLEITMTRGGGRFVPAPWADVMKFIAGEPSRAALIGVFRRDLEGPDSLVGYVLGYRHCDTVEYCIAASLRLTDIRAPLLYAPTWELMKWARMQGADWFDFGGVTAGTRASGDKAGGISEFKRYFRSEITQVGEEMVYAPQPRLSRVAARLSATASFIGEHVISMARHADAPDTAAH